MPTARHSLRRTAGGAVAAILILAMSVVGVVKADPAADALARLDELSRQALQTRDAVTTAQRDVDAKLAAQQAADDRHHADRAALEDATAQLQIRQAAVDRVAATMYVGGRTGGLSAVLTAGSPQQVIDEMSVQRAVAVEMADQMTAFQAGRERAAAAAKASERSAAEARAAAERSAAVRADLQDKWRELQRRVAAAEAQYAALTPRQRAVFDNPAPPPAAAIAPAPADPPVIAMPPGDVSSRSDVPEALPVGVAREAGLQPNTILAARAISARFPQISHIDGVRPDSKPWHPSGLAIDVMIPNPGSAAGTALGNEILAFVMSNAGRFGLQDVIWHGTYYTPGGPQASGYGHYDHVHITTLPSR